jgi:hypothetical protein
MMKIMDILKDADTTDAQRSDAREVSELRAEVCALRQEVADLRGLMIPLKREVLELRGVQSNKRVFTEGDSSQDAEDPACKPPEKRACRSLLTAQRCAYNRLSSNVTVCADKTVRLWDAQTPR